MINLFLHLLTEFGLIYGSGIGLGEKKSDPDKRTRMGGGGGGCNFFLVVNDYGDSVMVANFCL